MTNKINATSTSGLVTTGSNSNILELQADGITSLTVNSDATVNIPTNLTVNGVNFSSAANSATVTNLAALKALTIRPSSVIMHGRITSGDGGDGTFRWVAGATDTPDDAIIIQPTSGPVGRYYRMYEGPINVKWFGAKGDSTTGSDGTDNTSAIQAAINFIPNGTTAQILIDPGFYRVSGTLSGNGRLPIFLMNGSALTAGKMTFPCQTLSFGTINFDNTAIRIGSNDAGRGRGTLIVGGADPIENGNGTYLFNDGHPNWLIGMSSMRFNPTELNVYGSGTGGIATSTGTATLTTSDGSIFDSSMVGHTFYFRGIPYTVLAVPTSSTVQLNIAPPAGTGAWNFVLTTASGTCSVSGTTITRTRGEPFIPAWPGTGFTFLLNGNPITVTFVDGDTYTASSPPGNTTNANWSYSLDINQQIATTRIQKTAGNSEENISFFARPDGYWMVAAATGSGELYPFWLCSNYERVVELHATGKYVSLGGISGAEAARFIYAPNTVNRYDFLGGPTGFGAVMRATGSDTDVRAGYDTKGTGDHLFTSHAFGNVEFQIFGSGGTSWLAAGSGTVANPTLSAQGPATDIDVNIAPKNAGRLTVATDLILSQSGDIPISVTNLAALKALTRRPITVTTKGFATANDGGGGTFTWFAGDSTTADDGTVVQCASGPAGRYKRQYDGAMNLLWFGAIGDNIFDNTTAINNAVTAAKAAVISRGNQPVNIYVPSGLYKITGAIGPITSPLMFFSDNDRGAQFTPSGNYNVFTFAGSGIRNANSGFRNIGINAVNMTGGFAIALDWCQSFRLDNVLLANPYNGMYVRQAGNIEIRNTVFDKVRGDVGFYAFGDNSLRPNGEYDHCDLICFYNVVIQGLLPSVGGSSSTVMMQLDGRIHTVQMDGLRLLNGGIGLQTTNTPALASNLVPRFFVGVSLEIENMHLECIDAQAMRDFVPAYLFAAGSHTRDGIKLSSSVYNFAPSRTFIGTHYFNGIDTNGAKSVYLRDAVIINCSLVGLGLKFGVYVSGSGTMVFSGGLYGKDTTLPSYTEPSGAGISIDAGFSGTLTVDGVDLRGNVTAPILGIGGASIYSSIKNCPGYNPVGPSTPAVGTSPFSYTNGFSQSNVVLSGGSGVSVTIGGITISSTSFTLYPRQTMVITYSSVPTLTINAS